MRSFTSFLLKKNHRTDLILLYKVRLSASRLAFEAAAASSSCCNLSIAFSAWKDSRVRPLLRIHVRSVYVNYTACLCQPLLVSVPLRSQYGDHLTVVAVLAEGQVRVACQLLRAPAAADVNVHRVDEVFCSRSSNMGYVAVGMQ